MGIYDQRQFQVRFDWGEEGVSALAPISDVTVLVDVLSFTTCVDIATGQGATVFPCAWRDAAMHEFAASVGAEVADKHNPRGFSLKPSTLEDLPRDYRMLLPSLNGSHLTMLAQEHSVVLAGCLRNAGAVAQRAAEMGDTVAVIACGERWKESLTLRPALEDLLGAGAILSHFGAGLSPEARAAVAGFREAQDELAATLLGCASGLEKVGDGLERDVELAADLDVSQHVPQLIEGAYRS